VKEPDVTAKSRKSSTRRKSSSRRRSSSSRRRGLNRFEAMVGVVLVAALGYALLQSHGGLAKELGSLTASGTPTPSAPGSAPAPAAPVAGSGAQSAFVFATGTTAEPQIYAFINSATKSLNMTMYELSDTVAVNDLIARQKAGVTVRVILDQAEKSTNQSAYSALQAGGVGVVWSSPTFAYTHQKTISVDGRESLILTGNLTASYYSTSRDFGVFDTDPADVAAVTSVFDADYAHTATTPSDADDLLWSPTTAQSRVLSVIDSATKTLDVEGEEFSDSAVVSAIVARAKAGVAVRVVIESPSQYSSEVKQVVAAGGKVVGYSSSTGLYIHAKDVVADAGLPDQTVEVGSMNYTAGSLKNNRELGVILHVGSIVSLVESQFGSDFAGGAAQS
jgi:phosphatidylserine/phosphatidylglycerophosphate/cardiolipin synthase-like enzyme